MNRKEKAIDKLVELGRKKGCLTYEELNDIIPDTIVSAEEIDRIFSLLGNEKIKIVDSKEAAEKFMKKEAKEEEEAPERKAPTKEPREVIEKMIQMDDPVKMYLRQMGQISLLTREEELRLAEKIRAAERKFTREVLEFRPSKKEALKVAKDILSNEKNMDDFVDMDPKPDRVKVKNNLRRLVRSIKKTRNKERLVEDLSKLDLCTTVIEEIFSKIKESITDLETIDRKSTRLNSSHIPLSRMPSSA